jgi:hypothetical protein
MSRRCRGHGSQTNEALAEPHARCRRRNVKRRLRLNRARAPRRYPSGAGQRGSAEELISGPAPLAGSDATCAAACGSNARSGAYGRKGARGGSGEASPSSSSCPGCGSCSVGSAVRGCRAGPHSDPARAPAATGVERGQRQSAAAGAGSGTSACGASLGGVWGVLTGDMIGAARRALERGWDPARTGVRSMADFGASDESFRIRSS